MISSLLYPRAASALAALAACVAIATPATSQARNVTDPQFAGGANPNDGVPDTAAIQAVFSNLVAGTTVRFDQPGVYHFDFTGISVTNDAAIFIPYAMADITVEAVPGVTIEFINYDREIGGWNLFGGTVGVPAFIKCWESPNLTIRGASPASPMEFRFATSTGGKTGLPFLQGTIVEEPDRVGQQTTVRLDVGPDFFLPVGYLISPHISGSYASVWGAWQLTDGQPDQSIYFIGNKDFGGITGPGVAIQAAAPNGVVQRLTVTFDDPYGIVEAWSQGRTAILPLGNTSAGLFTIGASNFTLEDVTVGCWPGKAVLGSFRGGIVDNFDVYPQKPNFMLSASRDGLSNSGASRDSVTIRNCDMLYTGDDAFALSDQLATSVASVSGNQVDLDRLPWQYGGGSLYANEPVLVCDANYKNRTTTTASTNCFRWAGHNSVQVLDSSSIDPGDILMTDFGHYPFEFLDNTARHIRGVGLRCNLPSKIIRRCEFEDCMNSAIVGGGYGRTHGSVAYPYDSGPAMIYNIYTLIEDCRFVDAAPTNVDQSKKMKAAVNIDCPTGVNLNNPGGEGGALHNGEFTYGTEKWLIGGMVRFRRCSFEDNERAGIFAANVWNLQIEDCHFTGNGGAHPHGSAFHRDAWLYPVYALHCHTVTVAASTTFVDNHNGNRPMIIP
jgi:hypothetical protein